MERQPYTYFEKLEQLYVLTETRKLLQNQLQQLTNNFEQETTIRDDLQKIEQEIAYFANGHDIEELDFTNASLLNPAFYSGFEGEDYY